MTNTKQIQARQSLLDIAIQHTGLSEECFDIALGNGIALTEDLIAQEQLQLPVRENTITAHYGYNVIVPATGITDGEIKEAFASGEGIEFWGIEYDFIVS